MHACRLASACLAIGLAVALLAPTALVAQPVEKGKGKKSTEEDRRLQAQIKQLKDTIAQIERDLTNTRHALRSAPGPRGPHGPTDLDIALTAFTRLLELPHGEGRLRSKVIHTIRDVWGARDLGLKGALDGLAEILEHEGRDDGVCAIVLDAAEAMGPEAAPLFDAIRSLDTRGRPALRDAKARALFSIAPGRHIEAVVQKVDQELEFVMLSVGGDDGACKGLRFTILRNERFLGEVRVDYVYPKSCSASFFYQRPGMLFRVGDRAVFPAPALKQRWDGRIITRVSGSDKFYIIIGSRRGLQVGTRFGVFAPAKSGEGKTGRLRRKGAIRVVVVERDFALAEIVSETDPGNPLAVGDRLRIEVAPKHRRL